MVQIDENLAAGWLVQVVVPESRRFFGRLQLGFRGGCE
eukprot:CAMPEP_0113954212 /NCGR_PEP_ID=MMETSP0011_2-20120614/356_1 /TAXON_ID=101924 /ORGANISM="Rhodosorus marinus" /LENGTH=37 /DNA_ID=CAMNT_0000963173 /DNA_START=417 /DNA_END=530 /DNA_ORIENTATION=+ /assembly_acc=CAM_ASM_000156